MFIFDTKLFYFSLFVAITTFVLLNDLFKNEVFLEFLKSKLFGVKKIKLESSFANEIQFETIEHTFIEVIPNYSTALSALCGVFNFTFFFTIPVRIFTSYLR